MKTLILFAVLFSLASGVVSFTLAIALRRFSPRAIARCIFAVTVFAILGVACGPWQGSPEQAVTCTITDAVMGWIDDATAYCGPFQPLCSLAIQEVYSLGCAKAASSGMTQAQAEQAGKDAVTAKLATQEGRDEVLGKAKALKAKIDARASAP